MNKYELTILAPAYNEEKNITLFLEEFIQKIPDNWCILIVNDGSQDSTEQEILEFKSKYDNVYLISHSKNLGLGKAFETGFKNLQSEFVITIDADMSHGFEMVNILFKNRNLADIVLASIFEEQSKVNDVPKIRLLISKIGNYVLSKAFRFNIKEIAGGPRIYKTKYLHDLNIQNNGFESQIEILLHAKQQGASFGEVPIILGKRKYGVSKMNYFKMGIGIIKIYFNLNNR
jgi:glycosyltransferase involved in cell wall biosynthesis